MKPFTQLNEMDATESKYLSQSHSLMLRILVFFCANWLLCTFCPNVQAAMKKTETPGKKALPWQIEAEQLVFYHDSQVVTGTGNVRVWRDSLTITSDEMSYDTKLSKAWAHGAVVIRFGEDILRGDEAEFDLKTSTGTISSGQLFLKRNNVNLVADKIQKTGEEEYLADNAIISTCPLPKQAWSFRCSELKLTLTGQAVSRDTSFRVANIPLLYTPWLSIPINRYKKSGFLLPYFASSSRNGVELNVPYYWAITDSVDATFYQHVMNRRGWMQGVEMRYVFSEDTKGIWRYNTIIDMLDDEDFNHDGYRRTAEKRYWLRGKLDQTLASGIDVKLDVDYASDLDYLREFDEGPMGFDQSDRMFRKFFGRSLSERTDNIRPSTLQLTKLDNDHFLGSELQYNRNLLPSEQDNTVQTLPRLVSHGYARPLFDLPFLYDWDAHYVHYWRDKGDRIQRIYAKPQLHFPSQLGDYGDIVISAATEETIYSATGTADDHDQTSKANRLLYRVDVDASTTLARTFALTETEFLRNTIRPRLFFRHRPGDDQDNLPELDSLDRLEKMDRFTLSFLSHLSYKRPGTTSQFTYSDILRFYIEQSYDGSKIPIGPPVLSRYSLFDRIPRLNKAVEEHYLSDLYGELEWRPRQNIALRYDTTYNFYGKGVTSYNLWGNLSSQAGDRLGLAYRYNMVEAIDSLVLDMNLVLTEKWSGIYETEWSFEDSDEIESTYGLRYTSNCWSVTGHFKKERDDTTIGLSVELLGIGGWKND